MRIWRGWVMAGEWRTVRLGEITDWASGGTPPKDDAKYWGGAIPWISASSMYGDRYSDSELKLTETGLARGSRLAEVGTVLLLVRGSILHQRVPVGIATRPMAFNQDVKAIKAKEGLSPWFLLYWFLGKERNLLELVDFTGIGAGKFDTKQLQELPVNLPTLSEQEQIVAVVKALDDKIELNRRMNETLEAIARAMFKSWFIDFDPVRAKASGEPPESICRRLRLTPDLLALFPDRFVDSELGEIPEGWEVKPFSETVQIIGGGTPKTSVSEYWGGDIPWFSVVDAPAESDVFVIDTEKKITQTGLDDSSARILSAGTTIISARGTVGKVALVGVPMAMNQSCYGLRGLDGGSFFTYYATRELVSTLKQHSHGAVFDTITRNTFAGVSVVTFQPVVTAFETVVTPLMEKIKANSVQGRTLAELRDTLLPKLLSGELRVPVRSAS
ncbi:restriction endonuclease subunit S [Nitrosomonas nitrosa]|nr:restriction endonuclease subunit S [Nitrosomonas nitrosa]